jgi:para-nitrobenzyl esterase
MGISASGLTWEAGVFRSKEAAEQDGVMVQQALKAPNIAAMRAISADRILAQRGGPPSVDGWYMPKDPKDIFAAGEQNDITSFVGFTRDEGYGPFMSVQSPEDYVAAAKRMYGGDADKLLALYPADKNFKHNAQLAARDITLGTAMRRWAMGQANSSRKPSYVYMTAIMHHYSPDKQPLADSYESRAFHGSDNAFWLNTLDGYNATTLTRQWTKADYALADKMSDMLVAFAKTGKPDTASTRVPRYDPKNEELLAITIDDMRVMPFPGRDNVTFLHGLKIAPHEASPPRRPS